jgi:hypothetical protein
MSTPGKNMSETNLYDAMKPTRFGFSVDPRGWHVVAEWKGRTLLGEVVNVKYDDAERVRVVECKHFNGDPWPERFTISQLRVLDRSWPEEISNGGE